jgi:putative peptidoglycan lipid II flippase
MPDSDRVLALALGNSVGMTVLGVALVAVVVRTAGRSAVDGVGRITAAGAVAAVIAGWLGWLFERQIDSGGVALAVIQGLAAAAVATVIFAGIVALLARGVVMRSLSTLRGSGAPQSAALAPTIDRDEDA